MQTLLIMALSFQCFLGYMQESSRTEIKKPRSSSSIPFRILKHNYKAKEKNLSRFLKEIWDEGDPDVRILALSWIESRMRINIRRGDRGRACGTFQIHARHSYPLFRRRKGYSGWKEEENQHLISKECRKLENIKYSVNTVRKLLRKMDMKNKHPCHHNSGLYGSCDGWYKKRVNFWMSYFSLSKVLCSQKVMDFMAMIKKGAPAQATPVEKVQGYLDFMKGKEASSDSELYMAGFELAKKVKAGEEPAPLWSPV